MVLRPSQAIFPLWVLRDPSAGGFAFREEAIGSVVSVTGPIQLLTQVTLVPGGPTPALNPWRPNLVGGSGPAAWLPQC